MIGFDDPKWDQLHGGYRVRYDPRRSLAALYRGKRDWAELWQELHHQGDVDTASYAAVPHIVAAYSKFAAPDWNAYALVATIELARGRRKNPPMPQWLAYDYAEALQQLALRGLSEFATASTPELTRSILGMLALAKKQYRIAEVIIEFDEDELQESIDEAVPHSRI